MNAGAQRNAGWIVTGLKNAGIDLVSTLPDLWLAPLIEAVESDPAMTLVRLSREDEGLGICAGAYLGGRRAALVAQNAGLLLSTNAVAGFAYHHQIPMLLLIAQRGEPGDNQYYHAYKSRVTEPVVRALGLPCHRIDSADDLGLIETGYQQAVMARMPVVLLIGRRTLLGDGA